MNKLLTAAAVAVLGATAAQAADLPARTYTKAPVMAPAPVIDWSGFYLGGALGGKTSNTDFFSPDAGMTLGYNVRHSSFAAGAFGGVQRQFGQFVLGVEASYVTGFENSADFGTPAVRIFAPGLTGSTNAFGLKDTWTVGGRGGFAMGSWMPYITGGYANGQFGFNSTTTGGAFFENGRARLDGYYLGAGLDWQFAPSWIVGFDYKHYEFDAKTVATTNNFAALTNAVIDGKGDTFLARLSYKFGWAGSAARY